MRNRNTRKRQRLIAVIVIIVVAALLITTLISAFVVYADTKEGERERIPMGVSIGSVPVGGMTKEEAEGALLAYLDALSDTSFILVGADGTVTVTAEELGLTADTDACIKEALSAGTTGNLISRFKVKQEIEAGGYVVDLPLSVDKQKTAQRLYEEKDVLDIKAVDNTLIREDGAFVYVPGQAGTEVDIYASVYAINDALALWTGGDTLIGLVTTEVAARGSEEEFSHIKDVIGSFSTDYSSSSASRATNVRTGCERVNGTILYPGEEFSVYEAISPFTEENGYELAGSYENGTTVESFGGGVCQVSTTLYNAVIRAELDVTMRYNHSMIVSYVKPSADAAIAGTYKDLRFVNNREYPIYIEGYCSGGVIYFNIYGEEDRGEGRTVSFESEVLETIEPTTEVQLDSETRFGASYTAQSSHTGYKAQLWKIVTVDGEEESRTVFNSSTYQMSPTIIAFGTKGATEEQLAILQKAAASNDLSAARAAAASAGEEKKEKPQEEEEADEGEEESEKETADEASPDTDAEEDSPPKEDAGE